MAQFYFAWVAANETAFLVGHKRFDEEVFDFNLHHSEGDFASLDITIVNPRVGFLAPGRDVWAWLAYEHPTAGTIPLFFGRLVGVPEDLQNEQVRLSFIARPEDFAEQKAALAQTLKVAPYWDPIWFSPETRDDPDNVLESRSALFHTDRITHAVTISDIINGEDGNIALDEADVFYDSVRMHYGAPPVRKVEMLASVSWAQKAIGQLNITDKLVKEFTKAGSGNGFFVQSFTGEGLVKDWPLAGSSLGGGWAVKSSRAKPVSFKTPVTTFESGHAIPQQTRVDGLPWEYFEFDGLFQPHGGLLFNKWTIDARMTIGYDVERQKDETLAFVLAADLQSILTEPGDEEVLRLSMSSSEITQPIDESGNLPIRDQRAAAYFTTERGTISIEYLLALARARLLARARCVFIECEMSFDDAVQLALSCRKNVILTDPRLPGGLAAGKIVEYALALNGDDGEAICRITFACTVGQGGAVVAVAGTPDYVVAGYVSPEYQTFTGQFLMPFPGEIIYAPITGQPPDDDGINFFSMSVNKIVKNVSINNGANEQEAMFPFKGPVSTQFPLGEWSQYYLIVNNPGFRPEYSPGNAISALSEAATTIEMTLKPLTGGPFETEYTLDVSLLKVPKLIDLEASS